jgi:hypothetical protein
LAAVVLVFVGASSVAPAFANPPVVPEPLPDSSFAAGEMCSFPIALHTITDNGIFDVCQLLA